MQLGWGNVFGWIFNQLPGREERIRNEITKTKRQMAQLLKAEWSSSDAGKYSALADKLRRLEETLQNR